MRLDRRLCIPGAIYVVVPASLVVGGGYEGALVSKGLHVESWGCTRLLCPPRAILLAQSEGHDPFLAASSRLRHKWDVMCIKRRC